ncbi:MAG: glycosyltransferase family 2 protein [Pseudomonadota bacterium]
MRALIVTTMRNEGPYILEWLAHHRAVGFTDFLVFSNDCDDGTDALLDRLHELGQIVHCRTKKGDRSVQWEALSAASAHPLTRAADWILVSDVDEFLTIRAGRGTLADLHTACPHADGFAIGWRMFGSCGRVAFDPDSVLDQFTQAAPETLVWPLRAILYKCLFRNSGTYRKLGVHRPRGRRDGGPFAWVDGSGRPFPGAGPESSPAVVHSEGQYALAQLNHYAVKSAEDFLVKRDRGKPNHMEQEIDLAYWVDRNFNTVEDLSAHRLKAERRALLQDLRADGQLADLEQRAIDWRRARIVWLLTDLDTFLLFSRLQLVPKSRVLPMEEQLMLVRARGRLAQTPS